MRIIAAIFAVFAVLLSCLLSPAIALAWGPGVHMAIGDLVLNNIPILSLTGAAALSRHPRAFLYGALAADIFIGKGSKPRPGHSHNWAVGYELLYNAQTPQEQSTAYGYLSHLAADIVAHNYYVPNLFAMTPGVSTLNHVLVELRADGQVKWRPKDAQWALAGRNRSMDHRILQLLGKKKAPFVVRKQILRASFPFGGRRALRPLQGIRSLLDNTPGAQIQGGFFDERFFERMFALALALVLETLMSPEDAIAVMYDPIGAKNMSDAKQYREKRSARLAPPGSLFPIPEELENVPTTALAARLLEG